MRATLGMTGLLDRFDGRLFSATQVREGKPAPDVYLFAAKSCGVDPDACVVVEDSPIGVEAGAAAEMTVFGYSLHGSEDVLRRAGAVLTFDEMRNLPALLSELQQSADRRW
jgi:beta-phosphoglucomutase-like phosphatase (HAD superfamily)